MRNFKIVRIDAYYCDYLRKFDGKVIYNKGRKKLRLFIGILFKIDNWDILNKYVSYVKRREINHGIIR